MGIQAMKVHHLPRGLIWDHDPPSLTLGCKRFRPLAPKLSAAAAAADTPSSTTSTTTFDLKSFIKPDQSSPRRVESSDIQKKELSQVEAAQPGGTRWNPTQEQIGILEMLYRSGMRTPNAQQIEQITLQLAKYGKIEGKNVFYWFQNHKARERQKQKRTSLALSSMHATTPRTPPPPPFPDSASSLFLSSSSSSNKEEELVENNRCKRKYMTWQSFEEVEKYCREEEEEEQDRTLKLFPLHPEGRSSLRDDDYWN